MIDKVTQPDLSAVLAAAPSAARRDPAEFGGKLAMTTNAMTEIERLRDDSSRAERSGRGPGADTPTELRARRRQRAERREARVERSREIRHAPSHPAGSTRGDGPSLQQGPPSVHQAQVPKTPSALALQASAELDVAALGQAVKNALVRLGDSAVSSRDAASRAILSTQALTEARAATKGARAAPASPHSQPGRFAALMRGLQGTGGEATAFRLIDGTAGTLEIKVALSGQDLTVRIRPVDPAMESVVAASLETVRQQLRQAGVVSPTATITVIEEEESHGFDGERFDESDPGSSDLSDHER